MLHHAQRPRQQPASTIHLPARPAYCVCAEPYVLDRHHIASQPPRPHHRPLCVKKSMTIATSRWGHLFHLIDLHVTISRVHQGVGHCAPVVLLNLRAAVVQRDWRLHHDHKSAPLKLRHRVRRAAGKPQDQTHTA